MPAGRLQFERCFSMVILTLLWSLLKSKCRQLGNCWKRCTACMFAEMAATQSTVKISTAAIGRSVSSPNIEKRSEVDGTVPVTGSNEKINTATTLTEEPASGNSQVLSTSGIRCHNVDQCSLPQPTQLSIASAIDWREPTLFSAKRRLSYEHLTTPNIPTSKLCSGNTGESTESCVADSSHQTQEGEEAESDTVASKGSCIASGIENVKASNQMQSSPNFTPSCKALTLLNSPKAVSPLTKAFKSAFHMQTSKPPLDLQQSSHSLSTSHPVMIPSFSVPCLLSPHPVPQTFILDTPPLHSRMSKSPSVVSSSPLAGTNGGSSWERDGDVPQYAGMGQPSSGMGATISYSNVVYATPTRSYSNHSHSRISDVASPSPTEYSKSGCGKSSESITLESILRGHKQSANGLRSPAVNKSSHPSNSRGEQLKQALLHGSPLQSCVQQQTQPSLRCPRFIHCTNCSHRIDLKTYIVHSQQRTGNSKVIPPAHKAIQAKSNVSTAGLTVFDLEAICDTGHIDQTLSTPTTGKQQAKQGNSTTVNEKLSGNCKLPYYSAGSTKPCFPHSDELTRSFAPMLSDYASEHIGETTLTEGWGKVDTLEVDELLQLLETTSEIRHCSSRDPCTEVAKPQNNSEAILESVQPANHIVNEDYDELHSSSGKTSYSGKSRNTIGKLTRYHSPTTNRINDNEKGDSSNSDGEEEPCGRRVLRSRPKQPTSRICKRRPRKKQIKKTKKKDMQKVE